MIVQKLNLNLIPDDEVRVIHLNQYDKDKAALEFTVFKGSSLFDLTGCSVRIEGTKTDNKGYSYAGTVSGSVAKFDVNEQMTVTAGKYRAEVRIKKGTSDIGSANITFDIEPAGLSSDTDVSETELPEIMELGRGYAQDAAESAALAQERAMNASDYAGNAADSADRAERLTIRTVTASVDSKTGTPSVDVTSSGDTEKNFHFSFHNIKGEKGDRGLQGERGEKGDTGDRGPQGLQGERGERGEQGLRGERGEKGERGEQGEPGIDGTVAFESLTEEQRLSLKGDTGDTGPRGPQGERGPKGDRGDAGDPATATSLGSVMPDGDTTLISSDGKIRVNEKRNLYRPVLGLTEGVTQVRTKCGVQFTHYTDGRVLVNGTATEAFKYTIGTIDNIYGYNGSLYFMTNPAYTAYPSGFKVIVYYRQGTSGKWAYDNGNNSDYISYSQPDKMAAGVMFVNMSEGATANNITLYPVVSDTRPPKNYQYCQYGGHALRTLTPDVTNMEKILTEFVNGPFYKKNVLKLIDKEETVNGITFKVSSEKCSVGVSGTATDDAICLISDGFNAGWDFYKISINSYAGEVYLVDDKGFLDMSSMLKEVTQQLCGQTDTNGSTKIYLKVKKGTSMNYTSYVYLMIRKAYVSDDTMFGYHEVPLSHTQKQTLKAGDTSVYFTSDYFTDDSILDFYTSNGAQYRKAVYNGTNTVTVYFPVQEVDVDVIVRW